MDLPALDDKQWHSLIRYRFSKVVMNPVRVWSIDGKDYRFNRGSNHPKGLHMSNLGALVRHVFYDKKTVVIYSLDATLNRKTALIDDPLFLEVLKDEWCHGRLWAPYIPHSLEYLARCFKALIQNVIEPDLDVDTLKEMIKSLILRTFHRLEHATAATSYHSLQEKAEHLEQIRRERIAFGQTLADIAEEFSRHKPYRASIVQDLTDYTPEAEYNDPERRLADIRKTLGLT